MKVKTINLDGELVFSTVSDIAPKFIEKIQRSSDNIIEVNMENVSKADSSALALMLEGIKCALKVDKKLSYQHVPTKLLNLAKFCRLESLILNERVNILENSKIQELLEHAFSGDYIKVDGDGYHYKVEIISALFNGLSKVKRTQAIYKVLDEHIQSGELHALSVKSFTPSEWEDKKNG